MAFFGNCLTLEKQIFLWPVPLYFLFIYKHIVLLKLHAMGKFEGFENIYPTGFIGKPRTNGQIYKWTFRPIKGHHWINPNNDSLLNCIFFWYNSEICISLYCPDKILLNSLPTLSTWLLLTLRILHKVAMVIFLAK